MSRRVRACPGQSPWFLAVVLTLLSRTLKPTYATES